MLYLYQVMADNLHLSYWNYSLYLYQFKLTIFTLSYWNVMLHLYHFVTDSSHVIILKRQAICVQIYGRWFTFHHIGTTCYMCTNLWPLIIISSYWNVKLYFYKFMADNLHFIILELQEVLVPIYGDNFRFMILERHATYVPLYGQWFLCHHNKRPGYICTN